MAFRGRALVIVPIVALGHAAHAETPAPSPSANVATIEPHDEDTIVLPPAKPSAKRRALAIAAAVVPGIVVRGAGSWVIGEKRTAKQLFATGAVAAGAMIAGGLAIKLAGGSPESVPVIPLVIAGTGVSFQTWFADIWVAAGGDKTRGTPRAPSPWSLELGTTWLHDGYRDRGLGRVAGAYELGRVGFGASALIDTEGDSKTYDGEIRTRIFGASSGGHVVDDGSRLFARVGLRLHRDDTDDVSLTTGELELVGRLDLRRLDDTLDGLFLELSTGFGIERAKYAQDVRETDTLLLGRFAWGIYLGDRGELAVSYDHRRDTMIGGLAAWRAAGYVGSFGADLDLRVGGPWGVRASLDVGNAYVTTFALRYHGGPAR